MNIDDIPIQALRVIDNNKKLPIYSTSEGLCYYAEESIWSLGTYKNGEEEINKIRQKLTKLAPALRDDERELDKYVAVYVILLAINKYKGIDDRIEFDVVKKYVEELNKRIRESLDFQQVSEMEDLKKLIKEDRLYSQMIFVVEEISSIKREQFSGRKINKNDYTFGNVKYYE